MLYDTYANYFFPGVLIVQGGCIEAKRVELSKNHYYNSEIYRFGYFWVLWVAFGTKAKYYDC